MTRMPIKQKTLEHVTGWSGRVYDTKVGYVVVRDVYDGVSDYAAMDARRLVRRRI